MVSPAAIGVARATNVIIDNNDGPGEGFNDPTPTAPVGGNPGTTLGAQRLNAFKFAANIWASLLNSPVDIRVAATFDSLPCNSMSARLGQAGPHAFSRDFAGAPVANTWYPKALANSLAGMDLDPGNDDIDAQFNSDFGFGCAFPGSFYLGLDGNPPGRNDSDLVTVVLHELCHGLGFLTLVDLATGEKAPPTGLDDIFTRNLEDHSLALLWPPMSDAQRVASSIDTGDLHWVGTNVVASGGFLTAGRDPVSGHVQMFAPNPQQAGSSVSHWDTALAPNEIMEPVYTGSNHNPGLAVALLADLGWSVGAPSTTVTTTTSTSSTVPVSCPPGQVRCNGACGIDCGSGKCCPLNFPVCDLAANLCRENAPSCPAGQVWCNGECGIDCGSGKCCHLDFPVCDLAANRCRKDPCPAMGRVSCNDGRLGFADVACCLQPAKKKGCSSACSDLVAACKSNCSLLRKRAKKSCLKGCGTVTTSCQRSQPHVCR
jgi:hypothetical protein